MNGNPGRSKLGVGNHLIYAWKAKYESPETRAAQRLRQLEDQSWWQI